MHLADTATAYVSDTCTTLVLGEAAHGIMMVKEASAPLPPGRAGKVRAGTCIARDQKKEKNHGVYGMSQSWPVDQCRTAQR